MRALISSLAGASALLLLTACGGGGGSSSSGPNYATSLSYTNPTTGAFQLVKDPASSGGTLVLDLVCTNSTPLSGVSFSFSADTGKVSWSGTTTTTMSNGSGFTLGSPQAVVMKTSGTVLSGALSQKGTGSPLTPGSTTVLAKLTLTLNGSVAPGAVTFTDNSTATPNLDAYLDGTGVHSTAITVGTLQAQ